MSANNMKVVKNPGSVRQYDVDDRTVSPGAANTTIKYGEPVKACPDTKYVTKVEDGDPELGTDVFIGIAANTSDETSSADGTVNVITMITGTVIRGAATTASNMTTANLATYLSHNVCFDVSSDAFTIDENEADDPNVHGLRIVAGDVNLDTLDVIPHLMVGEHAPYL